MKYYRDTMENYENLVLKPEEVISYMDSIKKKKIDNVIVDMSAFTTVRWKCSEDCKTTCCDGGGICTPDNLRIAAKFLPLTYKYISSLQKEKIENGEINCKEYKLTTVEDRCVLYYQDGVYGRCALHRVALDCNMPIPAIKSFDCYIEPLEIICLDDENLFMTLSTEQTVKFSRWKCVLPCIQIQDKGIPFAYKTLEDVITYIFGCAFYKKLVKEIQMND